MGPRFPTYGGNDRTHYIRVPDDNRIELRGGDGAANPYLAAASVIGAGLAGIDRDLDPGTPGGDNGTRREELPRTLLHAVEALERDETIRSVLDCAGEGVASYFADYKKEEFLRWHAQVNSWEIDRYLTAF